MFCKCENSNKVTLVNFYMEKNRNRTFNIITLNVLSNLES